jgi:hypothetical protein
MLMTSVYVAIVAFIFSYVLIDEEGIFAFYGRLINRLPLWASKPLGMCELCFSGQLALWYGFFMDSYTVPNHVIFICITILFTRIVGKIWEIT